MITSKEHKKENDRLLALKSYNILDTLPEIDYDNLTKIAAQICGTPISLVSLLDEKRQWFKSKQGLSASETPKELAFCSHAINADEDVFIISDSRKDERFFDNPLVVNNPNVIFYAGVPLINEEGLPLGTLCVIDHKPRVLNTRELDSLSALAEQVMNLLKLRKKNILLEKSYEKLERKNEELERFAYVAAHDLKAPLNNIASMSQLLSITYSEVIDEDGLTMLGYINNSSDQLKELIDGLLAYSKSASTLKQEKTKINLNNLKDDIHGLFSFDNSFSLTLESNLNSIYTNKIALHQILINLVGNAIKYSDKEKTEIVISINNSKNGYSIIVADNGPGIALNKQEQIFKIFKTIGKVDKYGKKGTGIGLATVKKLIEKMGGNISIESEEGKGSRFIFNIEKSLQLETAIA